MFIRGWRNWRLGCRALCLALAFCFFSHSPAPPFTFSAFLAPISPFTRPTETRQVSKEQLIQNLIAADGVDQKKEAVEALWRAYGSAIQREAGERFYLARYLWEVLAGVECPIELVDLTSAAESEFRRRAFTFATAVDTSRSRSALFNRFNGGVMIPARRSALAEIERIWASVSGPESESVEYMLIVLDRVIRSARVERGSRPVWEQLSLSVEQVMTLFQSDSAGSYYWKRLAPVIARIQQQGTPASQWNGGAGRVSLAVLDDLAPPEALADVRIGADLVWRVIGMLPPRERTALLLRHGFTAARSNLGESVSQDLKTLTAHRRKTGQSVEASLETLSMRDRLLNNLSLLPELEREKLLRPRPYRVELYRLIRQSADQRSETDALLDARDRIAGQLPASTEAYAKQMSVGRSSIDNWAKRAELKVRVLSQILAMTPERRQTILTTASFMAYHPIFILRYGLAGEPPITMEDAVAMAKRQSVKSQKIDERALEAELSAEETRWIRFLDRSLPKEEKEKQEKSVSLSQPSEPAAASSMPIKPPAEGDLAPVAAADIPRFIGLLSTQERDALLCVHNRGGDYSLMTHPEMLVRAYQRGVGVRGLEGATRDQMLSRADYEIVRKTVLKELDGRTAPQIREIMDASGATERFTDGWSESMDEATLLEVLGESGKVKQAVPWALARMEPDDLRTIMGSSGEIADQIAKVLLADYTRDALLELVEKLFLNQEAILLLLEDQPASMLLNALKSCGITGDALAALLERRQEILIQNIKELELERPVALNILRRFNHDELMLLMERRGFLAQLARDHLQELNKSDLVALCRQCEMSESVARAWLQDGSYTPGGMDTLRQLLKDLGISQQKARDRLASTDEYGLRYIIKSFELEGVLSDHLIRQKSDRELRAILYRSGVGVRAPDRPPFDGKELRLLSNYDLRYLLGPVVPDRARLLAARYGSQRDAEVGQAMRLFSHADLPPDRAKGIETVQKRYNLTTPLMIYVWADMAEQRIRVLEQLNALTGIKYFHALKVLRTLSAYPDPTPAFVIAGCSYEKLMDFKEYLDSMSRSQGIHETRLQPRDTVWTPSRRSRLELSSASVIEVSQRAVGFPGDRREGRPEQSSGDTFTQAIDDAPSPDPFVHQADRRADIHIRQAQKENTRYPERRTPLSEQEEDELAAWITAELPDADSQRVLPFVLQGTDPDEISRILSLSPERVTQARQIVEETLQWCFTLGTLERFGSNAQVAEYLILLASETELQKLIRRYGLDEDLAETGDIGGTAEIIAQLTDQYGYEEIERVLTEIQVRFESIPHYAIDQKPSRRKTSEPIRRLFNRLEVSDRERKRMYVKRQLRNRYYQRFRNNPADAFARLQAEIRAYAHDPDWQLMLQDTVDYFARNESERARRSIAWYQEQADGIREPLELFQVYGVLDGLRTLEDPAERCALFASEARTGKTRMATLTALNIRRPTGQRAVKRILYTTTNQAKFEVEAELRHVLDPALDYEIITLDGSTVEKKGQMDQALQWAKNPKKTVIVVVNYESYQSKSVVGKIRKFKPHAHIIDEIENLRYTEDRTRAPKIYAVPAQYRIGLSARPIVRAGTDVVEPVLWLRQGRHENIKQSRADLSRASGDVLYRELDPIMIRWRRSAVLPHLPDPQEQETELPLSPLQHRLIDLINNRYEWWQENLAPPAHRSQVATQIKRVDLIRRLLTDPGMVVPDVHLVLKPGGDAAVVEVKPDQIEALFAAKLYTRQVSDDARTVTFRAEDESETVQIDLDELPRKITIAGRDYEASHRPILSQTPKIQQLEQDLASEIRSGGRVWVRLDFPEGVDRLTRYLSGQKRFGEVSGVSGRTELAERNRRIERFRTEPQVRVLITSAILDKSINLVQARGSQVYNATLIRLTPYWIVRDDADRLVAIGQDHPVTAHSYVSGLQEREIMGVRAGREAQFRFIADGAIMPTGAQAHLAEWLQERLAALEPAISI